MALTNADKTCFSTEKGWYFLYEAVVYDQTVVTGSSQTNRGYWVYYFGEAPRTVKGRVNLNDSDATHQWQLLGTMETKGDAYHPTYRYRLAGYEGGTPISVFRETGGVYTPTSPVGYNGAPAYLPSSDSRITDYAFIFCGKCPPGYCRAQEALTSPCRIHPGCV